MRRAAFVPPVYLAGLSSMRAGAGTSSSRSAVVFEAVVFEAVVFKAVVFKAVGSGVDGQRATTAKFGSDKKSPPNSSPARETDQLPRGSSFPGWLGPPNGATLL